MTVVLAGSPTSSAVLGQEAGQLVAERAVEIQPCPWVGCGLEREQKTCLKTTRESERGSCLFPLHAARFCGARLACSSCSVWLVAGNLKINKYPGVTLAFAIGAL